MVKPITYGRLGNFLFQAAATIAYAKKHGLEFTLPDKTCVPNQPVKWNPVYLQHLVNPKFDESLPVVNIKEKPDGSYCELPFLECWRDQNIILNGYWQSEKYFKEFRDEIIKAFSLWWRQESGIVSVHVRRGDYLLYPEKHPDVPVQWILDQMAKFPCHQYRFYSDDIPWCRENFGSLIGCSFSEGRNEIDDLAMMSCGEHFICSASTFSWWAAWLCQNPKKLVIMPKLWLVPGWGGLDTKDVVPPEWKRI